MITYLLCYNLKRKECTKVLRMAMAIVTRVIITSHLSSQGTEEGDLNNLAAAGFGSSFFFIQFLNKMIVGG